MSKLRNAILARMSNPKAFRLCSVMMRTYKALGLSRLEKSWEASRAAVASRVIWRTP